MKRAKDAKILIKKTEYRLRLCIDSGLQEVRLARPQRWQCLLNELNY